MDSREQKISENIGLVHACAKRFKTRGVEYDDLFQAGCLGLVKAVDHFDETRGLRFSTYAVPVILGEMRRLFRDGGSIKVGRSLKELSLRAGRAAAEYTKLHGRSPTINELAALLGVEITEAAQAVGAGQQPVSLTAGEEEGGGQIDVPVEGPDEKISELLSLKQVIGELEPRDRSIIIFRYFQSRTQTQTAEALGMTQVQVSRREKVILKGLRDKLSE
ncbi:RNA polymerase sporulation-specific sigma factor (sigma-F) [Ruminococcaceae bacterium BL-6]|jgi:RNA polymerase sporulation-specific sigma factor|nr:RNA polymerase sporulation-specific sigma factor (sigma-F) [Ruminococcaceae bacterium BL-6]